MATMREIVDRWVDQRRTADTYLVASDHCLPPPFPTWSVPIGTGHNGRPAICAAKLADEIMSRIERDGAIHRDSLIDVAVMCGAERPKDTAA